MQPSKQSSNSSPLTTPSLILDTSQSAFFSSPLNFITHFLHSNFSFIALQTHRAQCECCKRRDYNNQWQQRRIQAHRCYTRRTESANFINLRCVSICIPLFFVFCSSNSPLTISLFPCFTQMCLRLSLARTTTLAKEEQVVLEFLPERKARSLQIHRTQRLLAQREREVEKREMHFKA